MRGYLKPLNVMNSETIFNQKNKELLKSLLPDKSKPIFGASFVNPYDPIFGKSFEQIKSEVINEFLEVHEFFTEFEQIKHNLNN